MQPHERARLQRELTALADGDRGAFDGVFAVAWPVLRSLAIRLLADPAEAEDAAQRALLKLFNHASRFDPERDALPWVLTFGINECRTVRRRKGRRHTEALEREPATESGPEDELVRADLLEALRAVVGTLTQADQAALGLRPSAPSDAAPATQRKRKQRALGRLRSAWRKMHGLA
jgi:RNA polymerase sigma-70 factor (ECF subfamily)